LILLTLETKYIALKPIYSAKISLVYNGSDGKLSRCFQHFETTIWKLTDEFLVLIRSGVSMERVKSNYIFWSRWIFIPFEFNLFLVTKDNFE